MHVPLGNCPKVYDALVRLFYLVEMVGGATRAYRLAYARCRAYQTVHRTVWLNGWFDPQNL